jgi:hypothetical protein
MFEGAKPSGARVLVPLREVAEVGHAGSGGSGNGHECKHEHKTTSGSKSTPSQARPTAPRPSSTQGSVTPSFLTAPRLLQEIPGAPFTAPETMARYAVFVASSVYSLSSVNEQE